MSSLDLEQLLAQVSGDDPCGPNLEYDESFIEMAQAAQAKSEQQVGDSVIPAEEADWGLAQRQALELLERSKDLRVGVTLAMALLNQKGIAGFVDGLGLVAGLASRHWGQVHPQLDPDDDNDPTERVNTVLNLADQNALRTLAMTPLVSVRGLGAVSLHAIRVARDEEKAAEGEELPAKGVIDAILVDCELGDLKEVATQVSRAGELAREIETAFSNEIGLGAGPNLEKLTESLDSIAKELNARLALRDSVDETSESPSTEESEPQSAESAPAARPAAVTEIRSREDVIKMLDLICGYYEKNEPSSPLPLLLSRAKRLASKSFMEILQDLTPDGLSQAKTVGGLASEMEDSDEF